MSNSPLDCVHLPDTAAHDIRQHFGLDPRGPLRISFLTGPGDVVGTYDYWRKGEPDPRVPVFTYSMMFYELLTALKAEGQLLSQFPAPHEPTDPFSFVQLPKIDSSGRIRYRQSHAARLREALRVLETFKPHIILAVTDFLPSAWPKLARQAPVILSLHNTFWPMGRPLSGPRGRVKELLLRQHAKSVRAAICTSEECSRQIGAVTDGRIAGRVECPQLPKRYEEPPRQTVRRIVFVGRIEENKGIFLLLDAFRALMVDYPDISLVFAGSGTAEDELYRRIAECNSPRISFSGRLNAEGVHQALSQADLLVCPTTTGFNEGLALVGFEAAAHGVPSVLSSVVPAQDLLAPCASVCVADDKEALKVSIAQLIDDPDTYPELVRGTAQVRDLIYDRSRSWGSQLYFAMCDAASAS